MPENKDLAPEFYNKELSWLSFNERVLQEAADKEVPIIERVRFLGIFSSNLDEFFRVRVADVRRMTLISRSENKKKEYRDLVDAINSKVSGLQKKFAELFDEVTSKLAKHRIYLTSYEELSEFQGKWLKDYFHNKILRHISPLVITAHTDLRTHLEDNFAYLCIGMKKNDETQYCILEVPTDNVDRFLLLPPEKSKKNKHIILLEQIILYCLDDIFGSFFDYDELEAYSFKLTRDAEYNLKDEIDQTLLDQLSNTMRQRVRAEPVRCVYDKRMPEPMRALLQKKLHFTGSTDMHPSGAIRNFKDFIGFPNVGRSYLEYEKIPALSCQRFMTAPNVFAAIKEKDILLYYPFHRFLHFSEFIRQAAFDPSVEEIHLSVYRVAKNSRVLNSLMDAVKNDKKVTVVVELRARFDEQANINWAKQMTDAGIKVITGIPTLKIHSKICVISRREDGELVKYAHIGSGNFNEKTAKIYTDFSLFTCDKEITQEVFNVFDFVRFSYRRFRFNHLLVSPLNARNKLYGLIDQEIDFVQQGKRGEIILKINNLVDDGLIKRLYKASQAGVKVRMIVRGMCSLVPGVKGLSDNISVISIIDRYLEHPRIMVFRNGGDRKVFLTSADWMTRNIDNRIEVGVPIYDDEAQKMIMDILNIHFTDTLKARVIDKDQKNSYVRRGRRKKLRSQMAIYEYIRQREEADTTKE